MDYNSGAFSARTWVPWILLSCTQNEEALLRVCKSNSQTGSNEHSITTRRTFVRQAAHVSQKSGFRSPATFKECHCTTITLLTYMSVRLRQRRYRPTIRVSAFGWEQEVVLDDEFLTFLQSFRKIEGGLKISKSSYAQNSDRTFRQILSTQWSAIKNLLTVWKALRKNGPLAKNREALTSRFIRQAVRCLTWFT